MDEAKQKDLQERAEKASKSPEFEKTKDLVTSVAEAWDNFNLTAQKALAELRPDPGMISAQSLDQRVSEAGMWLGRLLNDLQQRDLFALIAKQGAEGEAKVPVADNRIPFPKGEDTDGDA
jgi:hypothetical protein